MPTAPQCLSSKTNATNSIPWSWQQSINAVSYISFSMNPKAPSGSDILRVNTRYRSPMSQYQVQFNSTVIFLKSSKKVEYFHWLNHMSKFSGGKKLMHHFAEYKRGSNNPILSAWWTHSVRNISGDHSTQRLFPWLRSFLPTEFHTFFTPTFYRRGTRLQHWNCINVNKWEA